MAYIYIKGRREPLFVSNKTAIGIRIEWLKRDAQRDTPLQIGGKWSGTLGEIRFIETDDDIEANKKWKNPTWTPEQLSAFHKEVEIHRQTAVRRFGEGKGYFWAEIYMEALGAVRLNLKNGPFGKTMTLVVRKPDLYRELQSKIAAYIDWQSSRGMGLAKRDAELEVMAQQQSLLDDKRIQ